MFLTPIILQVSNLQIDFLGLSFLQEHKLKYSFQECLHHISTRKHETEKTIHYLLHRPSYKNERQTKLDKTRNINTSFLEQNDIIITKDLVFGNISLDDNLNSLTLNATIGYLISTKRFAGSIFAQ